MLIKFLLTLLFLLFVWWFIRFSQRSGYQGKGSERDSAETSDSEAIVSSRGSQSLEPDGYFDHNHTIAVQRRSPVIIQDITATESDNEKIATLLRQIDENNRDITLLSAKARERDQLIQDRNTSNPESAAHQQEIENLESQNLDLTLKIVEKNKTIDSLERQAARIQVLEATLIEKDQNLIKLRTQNQDTESLANTISTQEDDIKRLRRDNATLGKQLEDLKHLNKVQEQKTSALQQQNTSSAALKASVEKQEQELNRLSNIENELVASQLKLKELKQSLAHAEEKATTLKTNDLELRRLKSEFANLQRERETASTQIDSLRTQLNASSSNSSLSNRGLSAPDSESETKRLSIELDQRNERIGQLEARLVAEQSVDSTSTAAQSQPASELRAGGTKPLTSSSGNSPLRQLFTPPADRDDLKLVKGIGPVMEDMLNQLGVTTFKQLADFKQTDIDDVTAEISAFPGRIERDDWVGQASLLYQKHRRSKSIT